MTTKNKRLARQNAPTSGMITPPEVVAGLTIKRTIGDDEGFGRCSHALQLLPNGAILVLVTSDSEDEGAGKVTDTYLLGEEVVGFRTLEAMIETPDAPA